MLSKFSRFLSQNNEILLPPTFIDLLFILIFSMVIGLSIADEPVSHTTVKNLPVDTGGDAPKTPPVKKRVSLDLTNEGLYFKGRKVAMDELPAIIGRGDFVEIRSERHLAIEKVIVVIRGIRKRCGVQAYIAVRHSKNTTGKKF